MTRSSTARRTNLVLVAAVATVVAVAAVAALAGGGSTPDAPPATTTTLVVSGPATVEGSWFRPVAEDVAVDYPVDSLTCPNMALQVTLDLCAVAGGGSFMVVGQEGFWSPDEPDPDGVVRVPLDLTVYVAADTDDGTVARPVLAAVVSLPYGADYNELSLHRPADRELDGTIVLVWSARTTLQAPALDGAQVLSLVDGAPTVVATEIGTEIRVGSADSAVLLVAPYLGSETGDPVVAPTLSVVTLRPSGDRWSRAVVTVAAGTAIDGFAGSEQVNSYGFPRDR